MSIIYDALKRIEDKPKKDVKDGLVNSKPDNSKPRSKPRWIVYIICAVIVIALLGISLRRLVYHTQPATSISKTAPVSERKIFAQSKELSRFSLRGIFFSDGEYLALINDQMVKAGELIQEAQVVRIEPNGVEIKIGDSSFWLNYP